MERALFIFYIYICFSYKANTCECTSEHSSDEWHRARASRARIEHSESVLRCASTIDDWPMCPVRNLSALVTLAGNCFNNTFANTSAAFRGECSQLYIYMRRVCLEDVFLLLVFVSPVKNCSSFDRTDNTKKMYCYYYSRMKCVFYIFWQRSFKKKKKTNSNNFFSNRKSISILYLNNSKFNVRHELKLYFVYRKKPLNNKYTKLIFMICWKIIFIF